eukprot:gene5341-6484_t
MDNFVEGETAFGQKVDLTTRIREILQNYPEGTSILKELIQNADDAAARNIKLCLDCRDHGTDKLAYSTLKDFQGPALFAYNDGVFTEADFESISRIGDSCKRGQVGKTGRFGVGFNCVYHLTDVPSFVSGENIIFFDPHCQFLPRVSSSDPGKRINFVQHPLGDQYPDQFSPYCMFGNDMKRRLAVTDTLGRPDNVQNRFQGTLFRFPLRTAAQASTSKLSKQSYTPTSMRELLREFEEEAVLDMLFLKHVSSIEVYEWLPGQNAPQRIFTSQLTNCDETLRHHRAAFTRAAAAGGAQALGPDGMNAFTLTISRHREVDGLASAREQQYLMVQAMGRSEKCASLVKIGASKFGMKLMPWTSIAVDLTTPYAEREAARAFCFLPLPVLTGLPVHVNGYFELSSNRRDIWSFGMFAPAGTEGHEGVQCFYLTTELEERVLVPRGEGGAEVEAEAPRTAAHRVVDRDVGEVLGPRLASLAEAQHLNVRKLESKALAELLGEVLPKQWRGQEEVPWTGGASEATGAFCFLPLPVLTGLPVHVNGYFELSSNRRDIWYGKDMAGGGRLRSDWNQCLLEDVVAGAYARLLTEAAQRLGPSPEYYALWPQTAIYPDAAVAKDVELRAALLGEGMQITDTPPHLCSLLQQLAVPVPSYICPDYARVWLRRARVHAYRQNRAAGLRLLEYCLEDIIDDDRDMAQMLAGVPLLPLADRCIPEGSVYWTSRLAAW